MLIKMILDMPVALRIANRYEQRSQVIPNEAAFD